MITVDHPFLKPTCADDIVRALNRGNHNRKTNATTMNLTSSRSHAVFQIYLKQKDKTASPNSYIWEAKMSLIDLAGLESNAVEDQAKVTKAKCQQESTTINRSLLTLWAVLNGLAGPKVRTIIPYRNSKLTLLLMDSLGGNCRMAMIANVSPSSHMYGFTHRTLKCADGAKQIKSSLKINLLQDVFTRVSESLTTIFIERAQIRTEQLDLELQLKKNKLRQRHSESANQQAQAFYAKQPAEKATCKHDRRIASLKTQQQHIYKKQTEARKSFQNNTACLLVVENQMKVRLLSTTRPRPQSPSFKMS
ncbi:hypothetical protein NHX12_005584 [Muraenolepis orangiensis]|uniref:Kinesin motor domain-containing protein n=1 Tax=Muraenolepis orangiensis TaxID=630683 RepID=A0A9Q0DRL7_9TELE|nr:hypothetical protein NHX12_005584 [Muraenolepis orangiensis]